MEVHGRVWVFKIATDSKTLELFRLNLDPASRKLTAFLAEFVDCDFVLVLALCTVFFFDLPLDRQAVAIPARNIVRVETTHLERTGDDVLEDLVQRMADMDIAVCVRRAIMQHVKRAVFCVFAQLFIEVHFLPALHEKRLALWQACAHREFGLRQIEGFGIIDLVGHFTLACHSRMF